MGNRKGNGFEREVARAMKEWWDPVEVAEWARTPMSGGWSSAANRAAFRACGDVMTTAASFPFSVECKRTERILQPAVMRACWLQAVRQAEEAGLEPLLVYRRNREPATCVAWGLTLPFAPYAEVRVDRRTTHMVAVVPLAELLGTDPRRFATLTQTPARR